MAKREGISLNPKNAIKGTGLPDDFDGTIVGAGFEEFTYPNTSNTVVALFFDVQPDGEETSRREHYAAGSVKLIEPVGGGCCVDGLDGKEFDGLNENSVAIFALTAVINAGYPTPEKLDTGNVTPLVGERFHFKRVDRKDAKGASKQSLVPTRYLGAGSAAGASKGNGKATSGGASLTDKVQAAAMEVLAENPDGLTQAVLAQKVNTLLKNDPDRMAGLKLVMTEKFLKDGPFTFDGKKVTL